MTCSIKVSIDHFTFYNFQYLSLSGILVTVSRDYCCL